MDKDFKKRFLTNTDDTGRFIVKSLKTGRTYFVEAIDANNRSIWGDFDPTTKKFQGSYGSKYKGCVKADESMIVKENGFDKIHELGVGESPMGYIERLDDEYYKQMER